jgi:phosphoribosylanthranilate isomerase
VRAALLTLGGVDPERPRQTAGGNGNWPPLVIAVIPVSPDEEDAVELRRKSVATGGADLLLFDSRVDGFARGSGVSFSWRLAGQAAGGRPFLVAGGIDLANARTALSESGAWGIDVAGGVESSPGKKDERSLRALFAAVRLEKKEGTRL